MLFEANPGRASVVASPDIAGNLGVSGLARTLALLLGRFANTNCCRVAQVAIRSVDAAGW
jgi:hypothetical protein